ncbi:MAG: restriction endonuclease subunit S [Proteobacteria bacterium]|nr:restriction endonuclease subunit S [Pseudomonadota bacterium]MBU4297138.1 restriction endonuclease subunit S [Pseudomonadota bacterium]MCG2746180.1 restriction endonuclease subunit S [Desulfobulbaceae bacterium]
MSNGIKTNKVFHGKTAPLHKLCISITDCHHSTPKWSEGGKVVVRNFNIKDGKLDLSNPSYTNEETYQERISRAKPEAGDLIITREAPMGEVCVIPEGIECCLGQRMVLIKPDPKKIESKYLLYAMLAEFVQKQINQSDKTGSIVSNLRIPLLKDIEIPLIDGAEQIAAVLSALDAKIDCNNQINAELESMAKTLYDYWFVQFDFPFDFASGKPAQNGKPYKSSGGKMVYNPTLKRAIPAGWKDSTLGETFKTHLGGTPSRAKKEYWTPGEVNWLSSAENPSTFVVDPDEQISKSGLQNSAAKLLPQGTVILSIVRYLRASILGIEAATNQSVVGVLETDKFQHCFIYPYLVREIPRLMALRTGAQQPHINKGVLDKSRLIIPDDATLEAYTNLVAPLFLQIKNYHQQSRELTQLRDWLLPMLMNGQVRVA